MATQWSPEDWARLGMRIREAREALGLSRRTLALMTDVSEKSIQVTEEGRVPTRWPKSLNAIEPGLAWSAGSMAAILDGGEPDVLPFVDNTTPAAAGAPEMPKEWEEARRFRPPLSPEVTEALPAVVSFGEICTANGAPGWMRTAYDNAVATLLQFLAEAPQVYEPLVEKPEASRPTPSPPMSPAMLSTYREAVERAAGGRAYQQAMDRAADHQRLMRNLAVHAGGGQAFAKVYAEQFRIAQEQMRKVAEQQGAQQEAVRRVLQPPVLRAAQQLAQRSRDLQASIAKLSAPAQQAALTDLQVKLRAFADTVATTPPDEGAPERQELPALDFSPIGRALVEARLKADLSLDDVAAASGLDVSLIDEMERGDFSRSEHEYYTHGDIRSLAKAVGLDPESIERMFIERKHEEKYKDALSRTSEISRRRSRRVSKGE